jgi:hypothetical protein
MVHSSHQLDVLNVICTSVKTLQLSISCYSYNIILHIAGYIHTCHLFHGSIVGIGAIDVGRVEVHHHYAIVDFL